MNTNKPLIIDAPKPRNKELADARNRRKAGRIASKLRRTKERDCKLLDKELA